MAGSLALTSSVLHLGASRCFRPWSWCYWPEVRRGYSSFLGEGDKLRGSEGYEKAWGLHREARPDHQPSPGRLPNARSGPLSATSQVSFAPSPYGLYIISS